MILVCQGVGNRGIKGFLVDTAEAEVSFMWFNLRK